MVGHKVNIYERYDFAGEVGASISCAMNGTKWLEEWKVRLCSISNDILAKSDRVSRYRLQI